MSEEDLEYVGFWARVGAALIDTVLVLIVTVPLLVAIYGRTYFGAQQKGFIAGPADVIDFLRVQSRSFMFTASAVPAAVGAALGALKVIRSSEGPELFARVLDNARYLRDGLIALGYEAVYRRAMSAPASAARQAHRVGGAAA